MTGKGERKVKPSKVDTGKKVLPQKEVKDEGVSERAERKIENDSLVGRSPQDPTKTEKKISGVPRKGSSRKK